LSVYTVSRTCIADLVESLNCNLLRVTPRCPVPHSKGCAQCQRSRVLCRHARVLTECRASRLYHLCCAEVDDVVLSLPSSLLMGEVAGVMDWLSWIGSRRICNPDSVCCLRIQGPGHQRQAHIILYEWTGKLWLIKCYPCLKEVARSLSVMSKR
jgi:hypothetical protein